MVGINLTKHQYPKKNRFPATWKILLKRIIYMLITFKLFKLNNLGDYHDLYVQSDTLLLADVFENFRKLALKHMN